MAYLPYIAFAAVFVTFLHAALVLGLPVIPGLGARAEQDGAKTRSPFARYLRVVAVWGAVALVSVAFVAALQRFGALP